MLRPGSRRRASLVLVTLGALLLAGCTSVDGEDDDADATEQSEQAERSAAEDGPRGTVTLAFAGDVHFEGALASLPGEPDSTLGAMSRTLREADVAMVNLEGALTSVGSPTSKELEVAGNRYWFRAPPASLGVMARSGVDVVTVANNHGADFGEAGLRQTIEIAEDDPPVAVIGAGGDRSEAFAPYRQEVRGTDVAVFTADASMRESADAIWASGEGGPGLASARAAPARNLLRAVRDEADDDDLVVVYLHWGEEGESCPTEGQRVLAESLAEAGADVVVGSHTHVLMGSGMLDDTYVNYGLANFAWYHGRRPDTGVLRLRVTDGRVADEDWLPGRTPLLGGTAVPLVGEDRTAGMQRQARARGCTDLEPAPGAIGGEAVGGTDDTDDEAEEAEEAAPEVPAYAARVRGIDADLRERMTGVSHDPDTCPVALDDLRYLTVRHVDFEGGVRTGEIVVAAEVADDVVDVFRELYRARWPIARMRLVDDYDGDDDRSMAANNSSGYNCRVVAGSDNLSDHAFGKAIDLNPIQNPYVLPDGVVPAAGRRFADVDRSPGARPARGVIRDQDVVVRAFEAAGWEWGDGFADYQHFSTD